MVETIIPPSLGWKEFLSGLQQSSYDIYFAGNLDQGRGLLTLALNTEENKQNLMFFPVISQPSLEALAYFRELGEWRGLRPENICLFLDPDNKTRPLTYNFSWLREETSQSKTPIDPLGFLRRSGIQGINYVANWLHFYFRLLPQAGIWREDVFKLVPTQSSLAIFAGSLVDRTTDELYHITFFYTSQANLPYEMVQKLEYLGPGNVLLAKTNLVDLAASGTDDLTKGTLTVLANDLLANKAEKKRIALALHVAPNLCTALQDLQKLRPELDNRDFERIIGRFCSPLYRQWLQLLVYCNQRLTKEGLELNPGLKGDFERDWKSAASSLVLFTSDKMPMLDTLPEAIRVDWDIDVLTPSLIEHVLNWWREITDPKNWYPKDDAKRPTFCYLGKNHPGYPDIARVFMGDMQVAEFDRRVYVPNYFGLTDQERQNLWDFLAGEYDSLIDREQKERIFEIFNEQLKTTGNLAPVILDACCGSGYYGAWSKFKGSKLFGLDYSPAMIERARATGQYEVILNQSVEEPFSLEDGFLDGILLSFASHLINLEKVIPEFWGKLKPGGILTINFYEPRLGWSDYWRKKLEASGFAEIEIVEEKVNAREISVLTARKMAT